MNKTPIYDNPAFNPDYDITTIRSKGFVIKVKNCFIRENENCVVFLYDDKILIKVTITDGHIDEYENLPGPATGRPGILSGLKQPDDNNNSHVPAAWLFTNNKNKRLYHKYAQEGLLC